MAVIGVRSLLVRWKNEGSKDALFPLKEKKEAKKRRRSRNKKKKTRKESASDLHAFTFCLTPGSPIPWQDTLTHMPFSLLPPTTDSRSHRRRLLRSLVPIKPLVSACKLVGERIA